MSQAILEHVNVTVANPQRTAQMLCDIFDWQVRWHGPSIHGGHTYHVGNDGDYVAVYSQQEPQQESGQGSVPRLDQVTDDSYTRHGGLNHIGVLVESLAATEAKVAAAGLKPFNHQSYDPGSRFYFLDFDGIEYEVVSYAN